MPLAAIIQKEAHSTIVQKPIRKKVAKPGWVYEPVVSNGSPYWDTLAVEQDDLPIVEVQNVDVCGAVSSSAASIVYPKGEAAVGVLVSRDFGGDHGICSG